jgi:hypothetical protein
VVEVAMGEDDEIENLVANCLKIGEGIFAHFFGVQARIDEDVEVAKA